MRRISPFLFALLLSAASSPLRAADASFDAVVSADGSGTHTNLQAAINAAPDDGTNTFRILIKPGTYPGQFMVPKSKRHIRFVGSGFENTFLTYPFNVREAPPGETYSFNPGTVIVGDDFRAGKITFENTSGDHGQA
ncbi:MAG: pectinesterase family protein, partial [Bryobacteraceae bacterium]